MISVLKNRDSLNNLWAESSEWPLVVGGGSSSTSGAAPKGIRAWRSSFIGQCAVNLSPLQCFGDGSPSPQVELKPTAVLTISRSIWLRVSAVVGSVARCWFQRTTRTSTVQYTDSARRVPAVATNRGRDELLQYGTEVLFAPLAVSHSIPIRVQYTASTNPYSTVPLRGTRCTRYYTSSTALHAPRGLQYEYRYSLLYCSLYPCCSDYCLTAT